MRAADETTANDTMDPTAGLSGEELFAQLCSPCHGPQGEGVAMLGYELQHPVREFSTWVARNGRPGDEFASSSMSAYSTAVVSDVQLEEIWDYLDSFPQPTTGEGLFLDYCRNCHGVDARGGVVNKDISDQSYLDVLERVRDGAATGDPGARTLYMHGYGTDEVSDAEVQLIVDYIASI